MPRRFSGTGRSLGGEVRYPSKGKSKGKSKSWWETGIDWFNTAEGAYNDGLALKNQALSKAEELDPYLDTILSEGGAGKPYHDIKDWTVGKKSWKDMSRDVGTWEPEKGTFADWWINFTGQKAERARQKANSDTSMRDAPPPPPPPSKSPFVKKETRSGREFGPGPSRKRGKTESSYSDRPTNINSRSMKRKYFTTGSYGGPFKGYYKKKLPTAALAGCVLKGEKNGTVSDTTSVYIGHTALPLIPMLRSIGWSIVRLLAKKWHQDFNSFLGAINGPDKTAAVSLRVTLTVRTSIGGVCTDFTWTDLSSSWAELGDNIMHHIITNCPDSAQYYEVVRIKFANIDATAIESLQTVIFNGSHLKIKVSGFSKLRVQNMTVSTSGDAATNENKDDIANNPLVGKQYYGNGHYHMYRFNNDYTTSIPTIYYASDDGRMTLAPTTATSLETAMLNFLTKPPPYKAFTNVKGHRSIKLMPGEIKYSKVSCSYKWNLNNWLRILLPTLSSITSLGGVGASGVGQYCNLSKNSFLGFEHMLHSGTEPDLSIGFQIDWTVSGIATYKKKQYCVPDVGSSILTKIVEEDPSVS